MREKRIIGGDLPGMLADRVAVPPAFVHPVKETTPPTDAVAVEPMAVAIHAFRVGCPGEGDPIVVIGCGNEGLLLLQLAKAMNTRVLAVDMRESQLALAERPGAARTVQVQPADDSEQLGARIAADWAPTVVFECAGSAPAVELALNSSAVGSRIVLVGLATKAARLVALPFVRRGLTLLPSLIYDHPIDLPRRSTWLRAVVHPRQLVTHVYGLDGAAAAMQRAASGEAGKVVDVAGIGLLRT